MSLEYAIEFHCEMRRRYDESTIRALGRTGAIVSRIVADSLNSRRPPSSDSVRFASHLSSEIERVEEIAAYCRAACPAHMGESGAGAREAIGCLGRIHYPIDGRFERFLADRLQLIYDTLGADHWPRLMHLLLDAESPFDGEATKELRRITTEEGLRFFELRLPIRLAREASRLTTDHLFDLLAGLAASDDGASGYQREIPVIALQDFSDLLDALLISELDAGEAARISEQSPTYIEYVRFAHAVRLAGKLRVRLLLD
jgi:hypothetical protein